MKFPGDHYSWATHFEVVYAMAAAAYDHGERNPGALLSPEAAAFLAGMGHTPREMFDYVEDRPDLDYETALLIAAARREYFQQVQRGIWSVASRVTSHTVPARDAAWEGIRWLPRVTAKARAKLRGELDDSLMFCCGGDRKFFRKHDLHPADFLRIVWAAGKDDEAVIRHFRKP